MSAALMLSGNRLEEAVYSPDYHRRRLVSVWNVVRGEILIAGGISVEISGVKAAHERRSR
jgi:hypothetical protein